MKERVNKAVEQCSNSDKNQGLFFYISLDGKEAIANTVSIPDTKDIDYLEKVFTELFSDENNILVSEMIETLR